MKKVAVMVLLSMLFVLAVQGVSFANLPIGPSGAVSNAETYVPLPNGGFRH